MSKMAFLTNYRLTWAASSHLLPSHLPVTCITMEHSKAPYHDRVTYKLTANIPKFCPICGQDSIQNVSGKIILNLFRCGQGHYFIFDSLPSNPEKSPALK